jgi:uncharacterized protein (DUF4415 family)
MSVKHQQTAPKKVLLPTPFEDAAITRAALADPDAQPLTTEQLASMKPVRGRPAVANKRIMLSMRVDADIMAHLRASGKGWQTKVHALLRKAVDAGKV